jgi:putative FmdB family regulatory protein
MPTYEYVCQSCGTHVEVFQRFSEAALTTCGVCGGELRKVFHPAGILFKGSGFYVNDSRSGRGSKGSGASREPAKESGRDGAKESARDGAKESGRDGAKESSREGTKDAPAAASSTPGSAPSSAGSERKPKEKSA